MPAPDRFLATILFTDIVGSTERAAELGDRRWRDLLHEHDARVRREINRHRGREVATAGDGFLVTFERPEAAVRCAVAARRSVAECGIGVRAGIHAGEVQEVGVGIGGIVVHIAARVAALAEADEILVSRTVRDLLAGSDLAFADRGTHTLKGVEGEWQVFGLASEPEDVPYPLVPRVRERSAHRRALAGGGVLAVAALVALAAWVWGSFSADPPAGRPALRAIDPPADRAPSVAVLPFANASPDAADEYFSDGLTEELISALSRIQGLRVPGRTSSFAFKEGGARDVRQIGEALRVGHVLEGSVRRSQDRLRIDARLVHATDGYQVWSETYDRRLSDALEVQAEIARAIAGALEVELVSAVSARAAADPAAYDHYLKGLYYSQAPTEEGVRRSIVEFQAAIRADPRFAPAHAGLAIAYHGLGNRYGTGRGATMPQAKAAAERAVELDPRLPESRLALALVKTWWDRDYEGAEQEFGAALELSPSYAPAHAGYGAFLMLMGEFDAGIASIRRAISLDPLSGLYMADLGASLMFARRYEESVSHLEATLERHPGDARPWLLLGRTYLALGREREAMEAFRRGERLPGHEGIKLAWIAHARAVIGQRDEAIRMLARVDSLARGVSLRATDPAAVEVALGFRDQAFARLERAERERAIDPFPLQLDPRLDPLRSDPRFRAIVHRMRLPELRWGQ